MTWSGGKITEFATCVLAPNPGPMTLDGTNTWILAAPGASQCLIIDPGPALPAHLNTLRDEIERRDLQVASVLLTHGHEDHAQAAREFAQQQGCGVRSLDPRFQLGSEGLVDGDVVSAGNLDVQVLTTPGHTSDSLCFFIPADGSLLTGDTILGRGTTVVMHPDGRVGDYLASLKRLEALHDVSIVLPGHGPTVEDPAAVLSYYLKHRYERLNEVSEAMKNLPAETSDVVMAVVEKVYADVPREVWPAAALSVAAQIEYLRTNA